MSEFRDLIATTLYDHANDAAVQNAASDSDDFPRYMGSDALLAMPEMDAIRLALRYVGEYDLRFALRVPEPVIAWVLP